MANHVTKQSNDALRPTGSNTVPVLFSLKNVQPLILNSPPASPSKEKATTADLEKASTASHPGFVATGATQQTPVDAAVLSRPTKVMRGSPILRTVGTVLLVLLVILVIRMSVPSGSFSTGIAATGSTNDVSVERQKVAGDSAGSQNAIPPLPQLTQAVVDHKQSSEPVLLSPTKDVEPATELKLGSASLESPSTKENETLSNLDVSGSGSVPALLAAAPSLASPPRSSNSLPSETPNPTGLRLGESAASEQSDQPYANASTSTVPPYASARPELNSHSDIRETSTPDLDSMEDLISLYRRGLIDGSVAAKAPAANSGTPARQVSAGSSIQQHQPTSIAQQSSAAFVPTTPYAPLSSATNWPNTSIAIPSSQVGGVVRPEAVLPTGSVTNSTLPMSGQSYPPPQRTYEPLTLPSSEAPSNTSGLGQNSENRYQAGLIRQPNQGSLTPIVQPKSPYIPVGTSVTSPAPTGATGTSFGYPPINVPSN